MSPGEVLIQRPRAQRADRCRRSYPVILAPMKTAISVPDEVFGRVEEQAAALGISRSEFFTRAAQHYLAALDAESLTGRVDAALDLIEPDDSAQAAVGAGRRLLAEAEDEW
jgi:Ribbon-helix-helix protein, copG family